MGFKLYSKVKLITDKYQDNGIKMDSIGIIMDRYGLSDYEIQFLNQEGEPTDIYFAVNEHDIIEHS